MASAGWCLPVGLAAVGTGCLGQNILGRDYGRQWDAAADFFPLWDEKKLGDYLVNTLIISIFVYGFKTEDIKIQRIFGPV